MDGGGERDLVGWSSRGRSVDVELRFGVTRREGRRKVGGVGGHGDLRGDSRHLLEKEESEKERRDGGGEKVVVRGRIDELDLFPPVNLGSVCA